MTVTFLVAIDTPDTGDLLGLADDIMDDLLSSGHLVLSVHPWARPSDPVNSPAGGFSSLPPSPGILPA